MSTRLALAGWFLLLMPCWPLALPFRLVGITFDALFALLRAMPMLPARQLGCHDRRG